MSVPKEPKKKKLEGEVDSVEVGKPDKFPEDTDITDELDNVIPEAEEWLKEEKKKNKEKHSLAR